MQVAVWAPAGLVSSRTTAASAVRMTATARTTASVRRDDVAVGAGAVVDMRILLRGGGRVRARVVARVASAGSPPGTAPARAPGAAPPGHCDGTRRADQELVDNFCPIRLLSVMLFSHARRRVAVRL